MVSGIKAWLATPISWGWVVAILVFGAGLVSTNYYRLEAEMNLKAAEEQYARAELYYDAGEELMVITNQVMQTAIQQEIRIANLIDFCKPMDQY